MTACCVSALVRRNMSKSNGNNVVALCLFALLCFFLAATPASAIDSSTPIQLHDLSPRDVWASRPTTLTLTGRGFLAQGVADITINLGSVTTFCGSVSVVSNTSLTCLTPVLAVNETTTLYVSINYNYTEPEPSSSSATLGADAYADVSPVDLTVAVATITDVLPSTLPRSAVSPLVRLLLPRLVPAAPANLSAAYSATLANVAAAVVAVETATNGAGYLLLRPGTATDAQAGVAGDVVVNYDGSLLVVKAQAFTFLSGTMAAPAVALAYPSWAFAQFSVNSNANANSAASVGDDVVQVVEFRGTNLTFVATISFDGGLGACAIDAAKRTATSLFCTIPVCFVSAVTSASAASDADGGVALTPVSSCIGSRDVSFAAADGRVLTTTVFTYVPPPALAAVSPATALPVNLAHRLVLTEKFLFTSALSGSDSSSLRGLRVEVATGAVPGLSPDVPMVVNLNGEPCTAADFALGAVTCTLPACAAAEGDCVGEGVITITYPPELGATETSAAPLLMYTFPNVTFKRTAAVDGVAFFGTTPGNVEIGDLGQMTLHGFDFLALETLATNNNNSNDDDSGDDGTADDDDELLPVAAAALVSTDFGQPQSPNVSIPFALTRDVADRALYGIFSACATESLTAATRCPVGAYHLELYSAADPATRTVLLSSAPRTVAVAHNPATGLQFGLAFSISTSIPDKAKFLAKVNEAICTAVGVMPATRLLSFSFANYIATFKVLPLPRGAAPLPSAVVEAVQAQLRLPGSALRKALTTVLPSQFIGPYVISRCSDAETDGQYGTECPAPAPDTDDDGDDSDGEELGVKRLWYIGAIVFVVLVVLLVGVVVYDARKERRTAHIVLREELEEEERELALIQTASSFTNSNGNNSFNTNGAGLSRVPSGSRYF